MRAQRWRQGPALSCACLIALLVILPSFPLRLTTAQNEPTRDRTLELSEVVHQVELELASSPFPGEQSHTVSFPEDSRKAVEEVQGGTPLKDSAYEERSAWDTPRTDADSRSIASAEGQGSLEADKKAEETHQDERVHLVPQKEFEEGREHAKVAQLGDKKSRDTLAARVEEKQHQEKAYAPLEAQFYSEVSAAQSVVEAQAPDEAAKEVKPLSAVADAPVEGSGRRKSGIDALSTVDFPQGLGSYQAEHSVLLLNPVRAEEHTCSTAAATPEVGLPAKKEVHVSVIKKVRRTREDEVGGEVLPSDKFLRREEASEGAAEVVRSEETWSAPELQRMEQAHVAKEAPRQTEAKQHAEEPAAIVDVATESTAAAAAHVSSQTGEGRKLEEKRRLSTQQRVEEVQQAEAAGLTEKSPMRDGTPHSTQAQGVLEETQRTEEDSQRVEASRVKEEERQANAAAERAARLREAAAEAGERLVAEREEVLAELKEEEARFQVATSKLTEQEQRLRQERMSVAERSRAAAADLHKNMRTALETLEQDVLTLGEYSVALHGRVTALSNSATSLSQAEKDVQVLGEEVSKVGEILRSIRVAVGSLTNAAHAAVASHDDRATPSLEETTLLTDRKRELETAHSATTQQLLDRLKALDTQLAHVNAQIETKEGSSAEATRLPENVVTHPPPSAVPSPVQTLPEETSPPRASKHLQPEESVAPAPSPFIPLAVSPMKPKEQKEESHNQYRQGLINTLMRWSAEQGYNETSHRFHPHRNGVPFKVRGRVELMGSAVVVAIATAVQTLGWCRGGCYGDEEVDEIPKTRVTGRQGSETSPLPPHRTLPGSNGQLPQPLPASALFKSPPREPNAPSIPGDIESLSQLTSQRGELLSQRDGPSAAPEHATLHTEGSRTLPPTPLRLNHGSIPPEALHATRLEVAQGPSYVPLPLNVTSTLPPSGATPPFNPPWSEAQDMSSAPTQRQPLPAVRRSAETSLPPLSFYPPTMRAAPPMQPRPNDDDDFDLHNPFLSRWS